MATLNRSSCVLLVVEILILINLIGQSEQRARLKTAANLQETNRTVQAKADNQQTGPITGYKCARFCSCSLIQVISSNKLQTKANLTKVMCENAQFSDVLTIDRRTQIIHISLPSSSLQDSSGLSRGSSFVDSNLDATENGEPQQDQVKFRMPRLAQFNQLREIVIDNLKFELCDSEVFKRGQRLRRLQWNHNQLKHISKACFRHLDHLVDLNLDYNQLGELESALFSNLLGLRSLSIAHNQLSELAAHQFANLTQLTSLNLVGNSFKVINLHLLEPMQNSLRLLLLAGNEIKSFTYTIIIQPAANKTLVSVSSNSTQIKTANLQQVASQPPFSGAIFKNLIKLNVDHNRFERIKLLQLHRFYNVKFLSIRANNINSIRDKAFNGLKLVELNLAANQLQSISKCAFCNSTIKRLVLSANNITIPGLASLPGGLLQVAGDLGPIAASPAALAADQTASEATPAMTTTSTSSPALLPPTSSASMLILSQSILGPLFGQLEYLDLSNNPQLADQLEFLLEPLLELKYLNLASVGLERSLPSPSLFKNLRHLRYLNLSNNQLDQLVSETIEPLTELEVFDLSRNKFSELDESFLVTLDDLAQLKLVNFASNPWYCSQCKISPLYDWILRSPIYNSTCITPLSTLGSVSSGGARDGPPNLDDQSSAGEDDSYDDNDENKSNQPNLHNNQYSLARGPQDYSVLTMPDDLAGGGSLASMGALDFDSILSTSATNEIDEQATNHYQVMSSLQAANRHKHNKRKQLAKLIKALETDHDDESIRQTMSSLLVANKISATNQMAVATVASVEPTSNEYLMGPGELLARSFGAPTFCLKCEFPSELKTFNVHELSPGDFKYCAGSAPRFSASEPKIGLTLAIVIIGALFCIIIIVIVIYRKKSNAYYPNELDITERLDGGANLGAPGKGQPLVSVSSDNEHNQYGDGTDYSSPPLSQSYESYSGNEDDEELGEEEEEEEEDEEGDEDEEDDYDEDEEEEEEDEREHNDDHYQDDEHLDEVEEADEPAPADNDDKSTLINSNLNSNSNADSMKVQPTTKLSINNPHESPANSSPLSGSSQSTRPNRTPVETTQQPAGEAAGGAGRRPAGNPAEAPHTIGSQTNLEAAPRPASLSASELLEQSNGDLLFEQQPGGGGQHAPKLVQLANVAGSLHGSQSRARSRQEAKRPAKQLPPHLDQSSLPRLSSENNNNHSSPSDRPHSIIGGSGPRSARPHQTHRQSSEHSTAGSVSFAASPASSGGAGKHQQRPHLNSSSSQSSPRQRRDRLVQGSQTIAGDRHRLNDSNHRPELARPAGGSMESTSSPAGVRSSGGAGGPSTATTSSSSPANKKLTRATRKVGPTDSPARSESRAAAASTTKQRSQGHQRVVHMADEPVVDQAHHVVHPAGRQAALRGLPGRTRHLADSESPDATDETAAGDSLALSGGQLAELPSDLDEETDMENGGRLVMDDYLDEDSGGGGGFGALRPDSGQVSFPSAMHESHSTHSALTQTGSRDFLQE